MSLGGDFFSSDAVEAAKVRLGMPVPGYGMQNWVILSFMTAFIVGALVFAFSAHFSKRATVIGEILPDSGIFRVTSVKAGTVNRVAVHEGELVKTGDSLFQISYDAVLQDGSNLSQAIDKTSEDQLRATIAESQSKIASLIEGRRNHGSKIDELKRQVLQLSQQSILQKSRIDLLQNSVNAGYQLIQKQYISSSQIQQRQDALLQARQSELQIEQNIDKSRDDITDAESQIRSDAMALDQEAASQQVAKAQLGQQHVEALADRGASLLAPTSGRITSLQAKVGDVVLPNQTLVLIVPNTGDGGRRVVLWVPSRAVGQLQINALVHVMFDAFPYQTFGFATGRIVEISRAPMMPSELPIPLETKEQMYQIVVSLSSDSLTAYGRKWPLRPGLRLTADLVLEEKSLLDWLLDPLVAAKMRMRT